MLLKGPATNVVKFGPSLAEGIANSGSLAWTPASDLEATTGPNGYGLQIIDDVTGQYQYSTQFGISKGDCGAASSAPASSAPAASSAPVVVASTPVASSTPKPVMSSVMSAEPPYPTTVKPSSSICTTAGPYANSTMLVPVGTGSVTLAPSASMTGNATTSRLPEVTANAASGIQAGLTFAGAVAAVAMMI